MTHFQLKADKDNMVQLTIWDNMIYGACLIGNRHKLVALKEAS